MKELLKALIKIHENCLRKECRTCPFAFGDVCGVVMLTEELQDIPMEWDLDAIAGVLLHD